LAVALAKHGDKKGAKELIIKVCDALVTETHSVSVKKGAQGLFDAVCEIGDPEIIQLAIDRGLAASETLDDLGHPKEEIKNVLVSALSRLQRFDEARKLLPQIERNYQSKRDFVDALVAAKRFDEAEQYAFSTQAPPDWDPVAYDRELRIYMLQQIAQAKVANGDKTGAAVALNKAYSLDPANFQTAWIIATLDGDEAKQSAEKIVEERCQFHRAAVEKVLNTPKELNDAELRHLLLLIGEHSTLSALYEAIQRKLRELGESIYPNIMTAALDAPDGYDAMRILQVLDLSKGNRKELRGGILKVWNTVPGSGNLNDFCYETFTKIGTSEDVPALLAKKHHWMNTVPLFKMLGAIAEPAQLPEIEKVAAELDQSHLEWCNENGEEYREARLKRWNEEMRPAIDRALQAIRARR
jgi:hypothetical protein